MLISNDYCSLNQQLHETNNEYGCSGQRHAEAVMQLAIKLNTQDILDYGCGKSTLANNLPFLIKQYDPAIPKFSALPGPATIVICTDVLEHVEPVCIDAVLNHLKELTQKVAFITIATRPAKKTLADGRNAHLIIQPMKWWLEKLMERFEICSLHKAEGEFIAILEPLEGNHHA
jgi:hypothetical protein